MKLSAKPLNAVDFTPYGDVISIPGEAGRTYFEDALGNLRPAAHASVSTILKPPMAPVVNVRIELLERHEFSSQTFIPLAEAQWLIVVCPHLPEGGPDVAKAVAFIANGQQGITYRPDTWHHGLTVLSGMGKFAVFMWRDGTSGDEEFVKVTPFEVDTTV